MIAACEEWREPLGVAPWELQLWHAGGGNVRVDVPVHLDLDLNLVASLVVTRSH